mmetsp:Transcript_15875/g.37900  ORF Transcript_15875/g.37900 Transcript_15875/m.37900 type:complete len:347 (-) Transcript_15875:1776-2816(-)
MDTLTHKLLSCPRGPQLGECEPFGPLLPPVGSVGCVLALGELDVRLDHVVPRVHNIRSLLGEGVPLRPLLLLLGGLGIAILVLVPAELGLDHADDLGDEGGPLGALLGHCHRGVVAARLHLQGASWGPRVGLDVGALLVPEAEDDLAEGDQYLEQVTEVLHETARSRLDELAHCLGLPIEPLLIVLVEYFKQVLEVLALRRRTVAQEVLSSGEHRGREYLFAELVELGELGVVLHVLLVGLAQVDLQRLVEVAVARPHREAQEEDGEPLEHDLYGLVGRVGSDEGELVLCARHGDVVPLVDDGGEVLRVGNVRDHLEARALVPRDLLELHGVEEDAEEEDEVRDQQ